MDEYIKQAKEFLKKTGATMEIEYYKYDYHFTDDENKRDIYTCAIHKGNRTYCFEFGQSLHDSNVKYHGRDLGDLNDKITKIKKEYLKNGDINSKTKLMNAVAMTILGYGIDKKALKLPAPPTEYDVLACLQTYLPTDFFDFCDTYGYDYDSIKAEKIYHAVKEEAEGLQRLFTDEELELLSEIQ